MAVVAFISVLFSHDAARWVGVGWLVFGVLLYVIYRTAAGKPVFKRVTVPARALTGREVEAEYGSILVPVLGHAARRRHHADRRAARRRRERGLRRGRRGDRGAVGLRGPDGARRSTRASPTHDLRLARKALARAKAVGEEYEGVEVATATVRARAAGEAIVREARRRGVEAIVLAAEEPTGIRGGLRLGGKAGLHDAFVGQTTRYVLQKAHCRVILTAPPSDERAAHDPDRPGGRAAAAGAPGRPSPRGGSGRVRLPLESRRDVRPRRRSRPRRLVRRHLGPARRPHRLRPRRGPALPRAPGRRARAPRGRSPAAASRSAPRSRWTR